MKRKSTAVKVLAFTFLFTLLAGCAGNDSGNSNSGATKRDGVNLQTPDGRRVIPFEDVVAVEITLVQVQTTAAKRPSTTRTYTGANLQTLLEGMGLREPLSQTANNTSPSGFVRLTFKTRDGSASQKFLDIYDRSILVDREFPENQYRVRTQDVFRMSRSD